MNYHTSGGSSPSTAHLHLLFLSIWSSSVTASTSLSLRLSFPPSALHLEISVDENQRPVVFLNSSHCVHPSIHPFNLYSKLEKSSRANPNFQWCQEHKKKKKKNSCKNMKRKHNQHNCRAGKQTGYIKMITEKRDMTEYRSDNRERLKMIRNCSKPTWQNTRNTQAHKP